MNDAATETAPGKDALKTKSELATLSVAHATPIGTARAASAAPDAALRRARAIALEGAFTVGHEQQRLPIPRDAVFRRLLACADLVAAAGGLAALELLGVERLPLLSLLVAPVIVLIAKIIGRYDHDEVVLRKSTLDETPALLTLAAAYALCWSLVALVAHLQTRTGGGATVVVWGATSILLICARSVARRLGEVFAPLERVLIIGSSRARNQLARSLSSDPAARIEVVGFLPLEDERRLESDWGPRSRRRRRLTFQDLPTVVSELDVHRVLLTPTSADSDTMLDAVSRTIALGVKVSIVPRVFEVVGSAVEFDTVAGVTVLGLRRPGLTHSSMIVKRAMDIVGAAVGLALLAPLLVVVAVAIKLDSPGSVFFTQRRVGRGERNFRMIKFRSMTARADEQREALAALNETHGVFKLSADPRVTRVGRWLRRTSIDELPQLVNVLRGDMSLVGPRPLVTDEDRLVEGRHRARLQLLPGMTGPWQVLGPSRPPLSEMIKTDYLYAANWSLWTDVKILLRTLAHVGGRRGL